MLLRIKANKNALLLTGLFHNSEQLVRYFRLKATAKHLRDLRKSLGSETAVIEALVTEAYPDNPILVEYDEDAILIRVYVFESPEEGLEHGC